MGSRHNAQRGCAMEQVRIRRCTPHDIDSVIVLEHQWEQEAIAYGNFNPMSREAYVSILTRIPAYFLVADHAECRSCGSGVPSPQVP